MTTKPMALRGTKELHARLSKGRMSRSLGLLYTYSLQKSEESCFACPFSHETTNASTSILGGCLSLTLQLGPQVMALGLELGLDVPPWGED